MLQKPAPETGARKLASVSGASVMQSGAKFFWRQNLESDRTKNPLLTHKLSISQLNAATFDFAGSAIIRPTHKPSYRSCAKIPFINSENITVGCEQCAQNIRV